MIETNSCKYSDSIYIEKHSAINQCIWNALNGQQAKYADKRGLACVNKEGYGRFAALSENSYQAYKDLAKLVRPGRIVHVRGTGPVIEYPEWRQITTSSGYLMVLDTPVCDVSLEFTQLERSDVPEMEKLAELSGLGFAAGMFEMGDFYGVRENGVLVAIGGNA